MRRSDDDVLGMLSHLQDTLFEAYHDGLRRLQTHQPSSSRRGGERLLTVSESLPVQGAVDGRRVLLAPPVYSPLEEALDAAVGRLHASLTAALAAERRLLVVPEGEALDAAKDEYDARVIEGAREMSAVSQLLAYRHVVQVAIPLEAQDRAHATAEELIARRGELLASFLSDPSAGTEGMRRAGQLSEEAAYALRHVGDTWPGRHRDVVVRPPRIRSHSTAGDDPSPAHPRSSRNPRPPRRPTGRSGKEARLPPAPAPPSGME